MELENKLKAYYITAIFGVVFALIGFTYNTWRLEVTEDNNNIRTAAFEVLTNLAELEQLIYAAHYDQDKVEGNPRKGWVKVGMVADLSSLIREPVEEKALNLKESWSKNWEMMSRNRKVTNALVAEIDQVREEIKLTLQRLK